MNRIALVGFMGAGKTTVGKLLAEKLRWCFFDSDEEMEKRTGSTVSELLSKDPEGFRRLEAETIRELLAEEQMVLATGGGAVTRRETLELLLSKATVVYLEVPLEVLWERTGKEEGAAVRPLLKDGFAKFQELFCQRESSYKRAHLHIDGREEPEAIVERIIAGRRNGSGGHNQAESRGE